MDSLFAAYGDDSDDEDSENEQGPQKPKLEPQKAEPAPEAKPVTSLPSADDMFEMTSEPDFLKRDGAEVWPVLRRREKDCCNARRSVLTVLRVLSVDR